jgi:hypothetical protein
MAKTYANLQEYLETTFPEYVNERTGNDNSLRDYIENSSGNFSEYIDKIISGEDEEKK